MSEARLSFRKDGDGEVADLPSVQALEIDLKFEQGRGGNMFQRARNKFQPADPDLWAIAYAGRMPVDRVEPKNRNIIFDGAVRHLGDGKGNGVETIVVRPVDLGERNADIDGFAFVGTCLGEEGFQRMVGAVVEIYDNSTGTRRFIGPVRFDITTRQTSALFGVLKRTPAGAWQFRKQPVYGHAGDWRQLASLATAQMGG